MDDAVRAYADWREACGDVWEAYDWWARVRCNDGVCAHAVYRAALDREEAAARVYARRMEALGERFGTPPGCLPPRTSA